MSNSRRNSLLLPILLVGFALRLYRLGVQSLWYDETVSAILARKSLPDLIAHTARDIHPPGYYVLLQIWTRLVGESEFALGYLSLIFGMLLIAGVYMLGSLLLDRQAGLWAAGLVAISPYNLWYSQEVRMYTLGAFLAILVVYYTIQGLRVSPFRAKGTKSSSILLWLGYSFTAALGLYVLYYFAFLLIPLNIFVLVVLLIQRRHGFSIFGAWLLANLAIIGLYLPWLGIAWRQATDPPVPPWRSGYPLWQIALESWSALSFGESVRPEQVWPLLLLTVGMFGLGIYASRALLWRLVLPLLTFGPLAIIVLTPAVGLTDALYHVRYVFTYSPPFYLILGAGLAWLWRKQPVGASLIASLLLGGAIFSIWQFHTDPAYASDDFRSAVRLIEARWRPGDVILINAGYAYPALQYYFADPIDDYIRLSRFTPRSTPPYGLQPLVVETGTVDGPASLGWGLAESDFFAMSGHNTTDKLTELTETYPRLWLLRIYDTVSDPNGLIRTWLAQNMVQFEDQVFSGASNIRVQGYMAAAPPPPQPTSFTLEDKFVLQGFAPPAPHYRPGEIINVALWWAAQKPQPTTVPYALSLKLWDSADNLAAQTEPDEWPAGNLYYTPAWEPGRPIRYPLRLKLPKTIQPGQYWLNVVFYSSQDGTPLEVQETGERVILLGGLEIGN